MRRASNASGLAVCALALSACGTLASPSTGDVDLPESFVGPLQALTSHQRPTSSQAFVRASESGFDVDEPSVVRLAGRRVVFVTYSMGAAMSFIGRADEKPELPPLSLAFNAAMRLLSPEKSWEGTSIASPSVVAMDDTNLVMAYAGAGGIGIATSTDGGMTWSRADAPALIPDATNGEETTIDEPELARAPDGSWYLLFESAGRLFAATASAPLGPWMRVAGPLGGAVLAPVVDADAGMAPDGGPAGFEAVAVGDPALAIVTTAAGRAQYALYYTARGAAPNTVIAAAGSFDGANYSHLSRAAFTLANTPLRAGSVEIVDARTILVWISSVASNHRVVSALLGPPMARGSAVY